jgi:hypothetical protein
MLRSGSDPHARSSERPALPACAQQGAGDRRERTRFREKHQRIGTRRFDTNIQRQIGTRERLVDLLAHLKTAIEQCEPVDAKPARRLASRASRIMVGQLPAQSDSLTSMTPIGALSSS